MFSIERPAVLSLILLAIPATIFVVLRVRFIAKQIGTSASHGEAYKIIVAVRCALLSLSWSCLVLALAGIYYGVERVPVAKNGNAVAFVFDISYSMNASDGGHGLTRLEAAKKYAQLLLEKLEEASVCVVLAKGDGIVAVPVTEDHASISSIVAALSPELMSAGGTNLGRGVESALRAFPANSAQASHIWLFTDGDETEETLLPAMTECAQRGVSVSLVGFGEETEIEVISGDGVTPVRTSLKKAQLLRMTQKVNEEYAAAPNRNFGGNFYAADFSQSANFIAAKDAGSAALLLKQIKSQPTNSAAPQVAVVYESQPVLRSGMFLQLAVLFFCLSFVFSAVFSAFASWRLQKKSAQKTFLFSIICASVAFVSCGARFAGGKEILLGAWNFQKKDYGAAAAHFLVSTGSSDYDVAQYSQYDLAVTYMTQREYEAALSRLANISPNALPEILYSAAYAEGVIASHEADYERAASCFKKALKIDSSKINAKINLEIALKNLNAKNARGAEQELTKTSVNEGASPEMQSAIFDLVRQNDMQHWKNSEQKETQGNALDY